MAKISVLKEAVMICAEAGITSWIWGDRGVGKSSLVQQVAAQNGWGFIDLRCSQLESSDIRGLPDRGTDSRTHYLTPAEMPIADLTQDEISTELLKVFGEKFTDKTNVSERIVKNLEKTDDLYTLRCYNQRLQELQPRFMRGILFLDELNRAQDDVLQAVFQLVLDRRIGQYVLPPGWCVVAAGNYMEGYRVGGFDDPAFLNRFCHLMLSSGESTLEEWVDYIAMNHGSDATDVIEFTSQNTKHLDGDIKSELGFSIQPSRRSWEMMIRVQKACKDNKYSDVARTEVYAGLVGRDIANSYSRYSCPVKPRDLLNNGVKQYESKLLTLDRNQLTGLMWGLVSFCKHQINDDKVGTVCINFARFLVKNINDKDVVVAFCRALVSGSATDGQEKIRAAVISNPRLAKMMADWNKTNNVKEKTFIDRLTENPDLQEALSKVAWGVSAEDKE